MVNTHKRISNREVDMSLAGQYRRLERLKTARQEGDKTTARKLSEEQQLGEQSADWTMRYS